MQFPITIGLRRSFLLRLLVILAHAAALAAIWCMPWPLLWRAVLSVLDFLLLVGNWRALAMRVQALRLQADGHLSVCPCETTEFHDAVLAPGVLVHPWLIVLPLCCEQGRQVIVLAKDSADQESLRQLRLWLRWRAELNPPSDVP